MSEEEKEALENIKKDDQYYDILENIKLNKYNMLNVEKLMQDTTTGDYTEYEIAQSIIYLLNIIEKQQKEIEKLVKRQQKEIKSLCWRPIKEYNRKDYDWVLVKYYDGDLECVPDVAEQRADGKWYTRKREIPFEVKYFFDMQQLDKNI